MAEREIAMRRTSSTFRLGLLLHIGLILLLTASQTVAGDKVEKSKTPVFPEVQPGHASLTVKSRQEDGRSRTEPPVSTTTIRR